MTHANRGPDRWARARRTARKNPSGFAADLYRRRVKLAHTLAAGTADPLAPFEHIQLRWIVSPSTGGRAFTAPRRAYCTCSAFCAALQMQLDFATTDLEQLNRMLEGDRGVLDSIQQLDPTTLVRDVRCQVCGETIKRGKS